MAKRKRHLITYFITADRETATVKNRSATTISISLNEFGLYSRKCIKCLQLEPRHPWEGWCYCKEYIPWQLQWPRVIFSDVLRLTGSSVSMTNNSWKMIHYDNCGERRENILRNRMYKNVIDIAKAWRWGRNYVHWQNTASHHWARFHYIAVVLRSIVLVVSNTT